MQYVCIMSSNEECALDVTRKLANMEYQENPIWSTRRTPTTEVLSELKYSENLEANKMIHLETKDGVKYGILKPIGHKKYTSCVTIQQFKKIRELYKNQVKAVYIGQQAQDGSSIISNSDKELLNKNNVIVLMCKRNDDTNSILAEILKQLKY